MTAAETMHLIGQGTIAAQGTELIHQRGVVAIPIKPDYDPVPLHLLAQLSFQGGGDGAQCHHDLFMPWRSISRATKGASCSSFSKLICGLPGTPR